jgi:general secretion pathway protein D
MRPLLATLLLFGLASGQTPETDESEPPKHSQRADVVTRRQQQLRAGVPVDPAAPVPAPAPGTVRPPVAPPAATAPGVAPVAPATQPPAPGGAVPRRPGTAPATGRAAAPPPAGSTPGSAQTVPAGQAGGSARAEGPCKPMEGKFLLAFNKADIVDMLEQASRWTCRNFAYTDEVARGKITLLSKTPVSPEEAYAAFLASLNANGIAIYQTGKYWKLIRIADAKKAPIPTVIGEDGEYAPVEQPITRVFRLHFVDPDQLRAVLGNFTSPQGADIQTVQPDVLVITDIALNIRRIEKLLEALDRPGSNDLVRVVQVQYAPARDVADKINQIFVQAPGAPGKSKRSVLGGVATPAGAAPVAGVPPAVAGGGAEPGEISVSKVVADERTNKLIVISDEKSFQRILELVKQLDTPTAGEGTIHVIFLKNANAEDLSTTLQNLASGRSGSSRSSSSAPGAAMPPPGVPVVPGAAPPAAARPSGGTAELFSGEVKVTADKPSNSLVVVASASDFAVVQRLIDKLDRPRRQVFVEAVIMEVDISNTTDLGVGMHAAIPVNTPNGKGFIPIGLEPGKINSLNPSSALQLGGFLTGLVGPVSAELKDIFPFPSVGVVIQALQSNSDVNVLSTPHLMAQDNEESEIIVGQNVPFQAGYNPGFSTGTTGTTGTNNALLGYANFIAPIQRQNVDLKLKIKPQIHEGDMVRMDIEESQEEIVSNDPTLGPTTAKRSVKTKVVVRDTSTIVIGGLVQTRDLSTVSKVPLLGDIPVLGWAFRSTNTIKKKSNLLLLLTPYIIRTQADFRRILERKQREQRELYELYYGKKPDFVLAEQSSRPGPLTRIRQQVQLESSKLENGGAGAPGERTVSPPSYVPNPVPYGSSAPVPPPAARPAGSATASPPAPSAATPPAKPPARPDEAPLPNPADLLPVQKVVPAPRPPGE